MWLHFWSKHSSFAYFLRLKILQVDFANHEECQEFYKNYEQCKASQQLMKYHMDMIAQSTQRSVELILGGVGNNQIIKIFQYFKKELE